MLLSKVIKVSLKDVYFTIFNSPIDISELHKIPDHWRL